MNVLQIKNQRTLHVQSIGGSTFLHEMT